MRSVVYPELLLNTKIATIDSSNHFRSQMILPPDKRKGARIEFSHSPDVQVIAIDGTWNSPCKLLDVSASGAKLEIERPQALRAKEFFLVLSATGSAYRRCELAWVNGVQVGVTFLSQTKKPRK